VKQSPDLPSVPTVDLSMLHVFRTYPLLMPRGGRIQTFEAPMSVTPEN